MNRNIYARRKSVTPHKNYCRPSRHTMSHFIHTLSVPICVIDRLTGVYLEANAAFADLLRLKREVILGQRDSDLTAGLGRNNLHTVFDRLEIEPIVRNQELLVYNAEGVVIKSCVRAELIDFGGREAVLVTFTTVRNPETQSQGSQAENRLNAANELTLEFSELDSPEAVVKRLAGSIYELIPDISTVFISLFDVNGCHINLTYGQHEKEPLDLSLLTQLRMDLASKGVQTDAARQRHPVITDPLDERLAAVASRMKLFTPGKLIQSGICVPLLPRGEVIGVMQVFSLRAGHFQDNHAALLSLVGNAAASAIQATILTGSLERTNADLIQAYDATIDGWSRALELRDFSTERHTQRVVTMTVELGKRMGLNDTDLLRIKRGAQLHDIGKMGIPDIILLKPGPLDEAEWRVMRKHPVYAYELLRPIPKFNDIVDIPYCHHEKWDGTGYPRRLRGNEIPLNARLFSIVDVWDALSSNRPYRTAWPQHQVLDYIRGQSNKQFEPEITRVFLEIARGKNNHKPAAPVFRRSPSGPILRSN